jgi:hypothetical protein
MFLFVLVRQQLVEQHQVVVPGHYEVVLDSDLLEPGSEIVADGECRHDATFLIE